MKPKFLKVEEKDSCSNCHHLKWGQEQGWDKCVKHGIGIYWPDKKKQICKDHKQSPKIDPRNP